METDPKQPRDQQQRPSSGYELPWVSKPCAPQRHSCRLSSPRASSDCMWLQVEKYRPKLVKDVVGNVDAVARLQVIAEEGNMPNMILSVRHLRSSLSHGDTPECLSAAFPCMTHRGKDSSEPVAG